MPVNGPINENQISFKAVMPWHEGMRVKNVFAGTLSIGTLVYINGTTTDPARGDDVFATITKADANASAPADQAMYVVTEAMGQNEYGAVARYLVQRGVDTSTWGTVGDPAYLSATAGETTPTAPAGTVQRVGYVAKKHASSGIIVYDLRNAPVTVNSVSTTFADGTAAAPSITFTLDLDTGRYRLGSNSVGEAYGGVAGYGAGTALPTLAAGAAVAGADMYFKTADGGTGGNTKGGDWNIVSGAGSAALTTVAGGAGGASNRTAGAGGSKASGTSGNAGVGGAILDTTGAGGSTAGTTTSAAGTGGAAGRTTGVGGTQSGAGASGNAGNGGAITDTAGDGGSATGAGSTGAGGGGGGLVRQAGAGGSSVGGTSGGGGGISDICGAGAAQSNAVTGGTGGNLSGTAGAGGANTGGASGDGGGPGGSCIYLGGAGGATNSTGAHTGGDGGIFRGRGGQGGAQTGAGAGQTGGAGGAADTRGGAGGPSTNGVGGAGGACSAAGGPGGNGGTTGGAGGDLNLAGGAAGTGGNAAGGVVNITGGAPTGTGARGIVNVTGLRAVGAGAVAIAGARVMTAADSGGINTVAQSSAYDIDLPSPTQGAGLRYLFQLVSPGAFDVTVTVDGGAATFEGVIVNDVTSVIPATGSTLTFANGVAALGDYIEAISTATGKYFIRAVCQANGGITIA